MEFRRRGGGIHLKEAVSPRKRALPVKEYSEVDMDSLRMKGLLVCNDKNNSIKKIGFFEELLSKGLIFGRVPGRGEDVGVGGRRRRFLR